MIQSWLLRFACQQDYLFRQIITPAITSLLPLPPSHAVRMKGVACWRASRTSSCRNRNLKQSPSTRNQMIAPSSRSPRASGGLTRRTSRLRATSNMSQVASLSYCTVCCVWRARIHLCLTVQSAVYGVQEFMAVHCSLQ